MRVLLIDDMRDLEYVMPTYQWNIDIGIVARTFDEGINALQYSGPFDILYLDHDLGDMDPRKTGYDIMCFLEANTELLPKSIKLVTSNPVGRQKMQVVINKLYGDNDGQ